MSRLDDAKRQLVEAIERVSPAGGNLLTMRQALADVLPVDLGELDREQHVPERELSHPGIELREQDALARLERWRGEHAGLFEALRADPAINLGGPATCATPSSRRRTPSSTPA